MDKVGLVLAGGGGKGAYHIGVWKALREYGVDRNITAVSGTSVGALNSALFMQGNLELAEEVWMSINHDKILSIDASRLSNLLGSIRLPELAKWTSKVSSFGVFSRSGFLELINEYLDLKIVSSSKISCYAACCEVPSLEIKYFKLNRCSSEKITTILLATSALPVIFDPIDIEGKIYIDGGIKNNIPIQPLYNEEFRNIIVVHLGRDEIIDLTRFPDANIIEILPQKDQGGFINGTLDFTPEGAKRRIEQGYEDAVRILKPIYEMGLVQRKFGMRLEQISQQERQFESRRSEILIKRENLKNELDCIIERRKD
jgi:NTE family protein